MKKYLTVPVILIGFSFFIGSCAFAQAAKQPQAKTETKPKVEEKKVTPPVQTLTKTTKEKEVETCNCQKIVIDALNKAYVALEEDEWAAAIKACTNAVTSVKNLSKTCLCLDKVLYGNIASAFLDYAKGGNILDGEKEPNCPLVKQAYTEAIKYLDESAPKIKDEKLKANAESIRDYCKEELEFVKDECS